MNISNTHADDIVEQTDILKTNKSINQSISKPKQTKSNHNKRIIIIMYKDRYANALETICLQTKNLQGALQGANWYHLNLQAFYCRGANFLLQGALQGANLCLQGGFAGWFCMVLCMVFCRVQIWNCRVVFNHNKFIKYSNITSIITLYLYKHV